jgi:hypothetical protein
LRKPVEILRKPVEILRKPVDILSVIAEFEGKIKFSGQKYIIKK